MILGIILINIFIFDTSFSIVASMEKWPGRLVLRFTDAVPVPGRYCHEVVVEHVIIVVALFGVVNCRNNKRLEGTISAASNCRACFYA